MEGVNLNRTKSIRNPNISEPEVDQNFATSILIIIDIIIMHIYITYNYIDTYDIYTHYITLKSIIIIIYLNSYTQYTYNSYLCQGFFRRRPKNSRAQKLKLKNFFAKTQAFFSKKTQETGKCWEPFCLISQIYPVYVSDFTQKRQNNVFAVKTQGIFKNSMETQGFFENSRPK